ncbi:unnamed protein product [Mucor hiemalis]
MPRSKSNWIYWLLLIYVTISAVLSTEQSDCDFDDLECLEDFIPTSSYSYVTSSWSSHGQSSSTDTAPSSDILSDFHEAKLVHPKPGNPDIPNIPLTPNTPHPDSSVQDNFNQDQDLGSSTENLLHQEKQLSALSNVEAGVLSACGVLVVAGIAVGIFVWKNTTRRRNLRRNHDMPMHDIESNGEGGDGEVKEKLGALERNDILDVSLSKLQSGSGLKAVVTLPERALDRNDFFTNWQRRNQEGGNEFEPKPKLLQEEIIPDKSSNAAVFDLTLQVSSSEKEAVISDDDAVITQQIKQSINIEEDNDLKIVPILDGSAEISKVDGSTNAPLSTQRQTSTAPAIPSALDPSYDPTSLTYPLQKFLRTPTINAPSPMQISVNIGSDNDDDDSIVVDNEGNYTATPPQPTHDIDKEKSPQLPDIIADNKGLLGTPLSQHLNKLLRHPSSERQRMVSTGSSSKMVEISLKDDAIPHQQQFLASPRLNNILGKFTKEPLHQNYYEQPPDISSEKGPAQLFIDDYKKKYLEEHGRPFMSPLDLPDDQYVPLRDAAGPPLISRAEVLADPVRRLGEDEIALWEHSRRKKELKGKEIWDENTLREEVEAYDRNRIAQYYCVSEPQEAIVPTQEGNSRDQQVLP